jgi:hypothetical protein
MSSGAMLRVPGLQELLNRCQALIRIHTALRGIAETVCTVIICLLVACAADYLISFSGTGRLVMLVISVGLVVYVAWTRLIHPLMQSAPAEVLGAAVDLQFPELQESLATLISIEEPGVSTGESGSLLMRERLEGQVRQQIRHLKPSAVVPSSGTLKRWGTAILCVCLALIPVGLWPSGSQLLVQRFLMPFANLASPSNLYFEISDGNRVVAKGSDVEFHAVPRWRTDAAGELPSNVLIQIEGSTGQLEELQMSYDDVEGHFSVVVDDVRDSLRYRVIGGGAATEWFQLTVAEAPRITSIVLTETPLAYTGRPVEVFDGVVGDIPVFERSAIDIVLTLNKPVRSLELGWKHWKPIDISSSDNTSTLLLPGQEQQLLPEDLAATVISLPVARPPGGPPVVTPQISADGLTAVFHFEAMGSGQFEFHASDEFGLANGTEPTRRLLVSTDTPPKLQVTGIREGLEVRPDDVVPLDCVVTDDIGVGLLEVHFQKNADAVRIEPATTLERGSTSVEHKFRIDLKSLDAKTGDTVSFRVKAADERPIPGPQLVWKGPWTIVLTADASPLGQQALREADQQLVEALRRLEQELHNDAAKGNELKEQARKNWDEPTQQGVRELSEKEQTQGRGLQKLSEEVAQHPMMQKQAEKLTELAERIRQQVPDKLNQATAANRDQAVGQIQDSVNDLNRIRDELHKATDEIEKIAQLEQELAELNRLALEADQLARDSEALQQKSAESRPEEGQTPEELQNQLKEDRQRLQQEQQKLSEDLGLLLQRKHELLQAARNAQLEQAAEIAKETRRLAQQQQQLAEGVNEEARDASRDVQELANELQRARNDVEQLGRQMQQQAQEVPKPEVQPLDDAIRELRQGNLSAPQDGIEQTQQQLRNAQEALAKELAAPVEDPNQPKDEATRQQEDKKRAEQNEKRQNLAENAKQADQKLAELSEKLDKARLDLGASPEAAEAAAPQNDAKSDAEAGEQPPSAGQPEVQPPQNGDPLAPERTELLKALEQLVEAAHEQAETLAADPKAPGGSRNSSQQAAQRGDEAQRHAQAGQFQRAAERMRQAASESANAADQLKSDDQQDRRSQLQQQRDNFNRLSDSLHRLQEDDASQVATQRESQGNVAEQAKELSEPLTELAERLNLPALGMQHLSRPAQDAAEAARTGSERGQQAAEGLNQTQLRQAAQSAQEAAEQLNRAAQMADQAAQGQQDPNAVIPNEVGDSVNDAMYSLKKAADMMNQESSQVDAGNEGQQSPGGSAEGQSREPGSNSPQSAGQSGGEQPGTPQNGEGNPAQQSGGEGLAPQGQPQEGQGQQGQAGQGNASQGSAQSGQPGSPGAAGQQPGNQAEGSARQMANAAQSLQNAARQALPGDFSPGRLNPEGSEASSDPRGEGNPAMFDGQIPGATGRQGRGRVWGQLQDELGSNVGDGSREVLDTEYSELIRRYRRDLARTAEPPPKSDSIQSPKK